MFLYRYKHKSESIIGLLLFDEDQITMSPLWLRKLNFMVDFPRKYKYELSWNAKYSICNHLYHVWDI